MVSVAGSKKRFLIKQTHVVEEWAVVDCWSLKEAVSIWDEPDLEKSAKVLRRGKIRTKRLRTQ